MKTNTNIIKGFKAVDFMRKTRDEISKEIQDMSFEEIKQYFKERKEKLLKQEISEVAI